jgi:hypothetical protein
MEGQARKLHSNSFGGGKNAVSLSKNISWEGNPG